MFRRATAVAVPALVLALAACGGGEGSGSGSASSGAEEDLAAQVQEEGVLRVGTEGTYSPFSFHDPATNELTGYDVEVVTEVAERLGVEVEFSEVPWDAIFAGLEAERYDVVANQVSITEERQGLYDFSAPYTVSTGAIVTRADDTSVTSLADVAGRTAAQTATSNWAEIAREAGASVETVEGFTQTVALLQQDRVDLTINDDLAVLNYLETSGDTSVKIAARTDDQTEQAFAFRKGSGLADDVDAVLEEMRADGTLAQISTEWFGEDVSS
ncbi:amino acid ABC transporter substrate-binding protein [Quadrisphaera sp. DSM 44207]|uniref:amino acid ABC transporter substrate-binding protein n=1 Tax=Quadrisphaera sp. DSM 44207 TaxID=1881057 RepID=UPI00088BCA93|nr:amino acid ABC transporter substrate-binding protein [Quadrisphaera sp. DSM 44207]SDQ73814.1 amino acid ABC transporter substrate-binding protein, PAAT family [Quadrisphaera sp. DSM 44207]